MSQIAKITKRLIPNLALLFALFVGASLHGGDLKVNLSPPQAVKAGARWTVDGGVWKTSGTTVKKLSNGTHQVTFKPVNGWLTPAPISVVIGNANVTLSQTYQLPAALSINLTPPSGQWRIDAGAWLASGGTKEGTKGTKGVRL